MNHWTAAAGIVEAFVRDGTSIPHELIWRTLAPLLPDAPIAALDLGGGDAALAIRLAAAGHSATVVDIDPRMLDLAAQRLQHAPGGIADRVTLTEGGAGQVTGRYDLVCCHSVLMYEDDPAPMLDAIVRACTPGALISIVAVNPAAIALRPGLAGRWREARIALETGDQAHGPYAPSRNHPRETIEALLTARGAMPIGWSGIGTFTDHYVDAIVADDPEEVLRAEWLAGQRDPYRQVARCYHLLARATD